MQQPDARTFAAYFARENFDDSIARIRNDSEIHRIYEFEAGKSIKFFSFLDTFPVHRADFVYYGFMRFDTINSDIPYNAPLSKSLNTDLISISLPSFYIPLPQLSFAIPAILNWFEKYELQINLIHTTKDSLESKYCKERKYLVNALAQSFATNRYQYIQL